jgi:hypothetical protein
MDNYSVSVIESIADWENNHEQWNNLLEKSTSNNIFLTFEWLYSWWNIFSNDRKKLFILNIYKNNTLVGIAPWYINNMKHGPFSQKRFEFIGSPEAGSDYLDVICMAGEEINISHTLYKYIHNIFKEWDSLYFYDFPANSMFFMNFIYELDKDGKYYVLNTASYCPIINLPNNIEEYKSSMTSKRQKKIDWQINKLGQKGKITIDDIICNGSEKYIDEYFDFYENVRNINNEKLRMFVKHYDKYLGKNSTIQIITLKQDEIKLASILHLLYGKSKYNYLVATNKNYDKNISVGEILIYECINNSIKANIIKYDFLKGEEPYKFKWSNDGKRSLSIMYYKFRFITIHLLLFESIKNVAKYILR